MSPSSLSHVSLSAPFPLRGFPSRLTFFEGLPALLELLLCLPLECPLRSLLMFPSSLEAPPEAFETPFKALPASLLLLR